jgi:hypothetical protein
MRQRRSQRPEDPTRARAQLAAREREVGDVLADLGVACEVQRAEVTDPSSGSLVVRGRQDGRDVIVKVADTPQGGDRLLRHVAAARAVREGAAPALGALVPCVLDVITRADRTVTIETARPGRRLLDRHRAAARRGRHEMLEVLAAVHQLEARTLRPGAADREAWVDRPLATVRGRAGDPAADASLRRLCDELGTALDRPLRVGRVHGDPWPGNVLTTPWGTVTGIVDWESSRACAPADVDLAQVVLFSSSAAIGPLVTEVLERNAPPRATDTAARRAFTAAPNDFGVRTAFLLGWLWHVADNIEKSPAYHGEWFATNVTAVLRAVDRTRR